MSGATTKSKSNNIDFVTLEQEVQQLHVENKQLRSHVDDLEYQNDYLRRQVFGQKSERSNKENEPAEGQLTFLDVVPDTPEKEPLETDDKSTDDKPKKKRARRKVNPNLQTREIILSAPEEMKKDEDGNDLNLLGYEISERIEIEAAKVIRVVIKREKWGYKDSQETVYTEPHKATIVPKGKLTDKSLHHLVIEKYFKAVPIYRQLQMLNSQGADLCKSTVSDNIKRAADFFAPIVESIRLQILEHKYIHGDETTIKRQQKEHCHIGYMWALKDWRQVYFHYQEGRGRKYLEEILKLSPGPPGEESYYSGYLMSDDYSAYEYVCNKTGATRMACWVHVRRKFENLMNTNELAKEYVALIGKLYYQEKQARKKRDKDNLTDEQYHELRYTQRQEKSKQIIQLIEQKLRDDELKTTPGSQLSKAMNYCRKLMGHLKVYLTDGDLPIDNNPVERSIRPVVIGRKNWLFIGSEDAGRWAAIHYTLMESCRQQNLDPYAYLEYATEAMHAGMGDYGRLTPFALRKKVRKIETNF